MSIVNITKNVAINSLRFALALVFAFSGFVKAVDPMGTVYKMADYAEAFGLAVPPGLLLVGAVVLILWEYVMGVCLFFGLYRRFYLSASIFFLAVMTPLTLYIALRNPVSDCGCFGDAVVLTHLQTLGKNVALLLMSIVVLVGYRRVCRVVSERTQWLVFVYAAGSVMVLISHCLRHLPAIDFRPYHVGANIVEGMTIPEDAPQDEYETLFVLEREGERRTFTFDEYPDSTWTFVSRENRLVSKGYTPPITDFHLASTEGEEMTWEVLEQPGYTFLMVAADLTRTDEGMLDVVNDLYDYAKVNGYPFYMLTSSNSEDIAGWTYRTGATYPYLLADEILLKTMVRANPGLILLKDSTVVAKWSKADMPRDELLSMPIERNTTLLHEIQHRTGRARRTVMWMLLPLVLLVVMDKMICYKKEKTIVNSSINN